MDIVEILRLGLPGLVFLLAMFSYRLLSKEQHKPTPNASILKSIKQFMYVNIFLAILTASAPVLETAPTPDKSVYNVQARLSGTRLEPNKAAVCENAQYSGRYVLITDPEKTRMVQVYAMGILPCQDQEVIALDTETTARLGWPQHQSSRLVEVTAAAKGQMYILKNI